ncbi:MAG: M15 family metallopeptidase [Christensenellales bacterium]
MKKTIGWLLVLAALLPLRTVHAAAQGTKTATVDNCIIAVNVRSGPSFGSMEIGLAFKGSAFAVLPDNASSGWLAVDYNGREGYIYAKYASVAETPVKTAEPPDSADTKYQYLLGTDATYFTISNPPKGYTSSAAAAANMEKITVKCWKINGGGGKVSSSIAMTVHRKLAKDVEKIFSEIYALPGKFPIDTLTSFKYTKVTGPMLDDVTLLSHHSLGAAIDINYRQNDYYLGKGNDLRDTKDPYYIPEEVINIFAKHGWYWGGDFEICSDTMHFQYLGLDFLSYQGKNPFVEYKAASPAMKAVKIEHIQARLKAIGLYGGAIDGVYGNGTQKAVEEFQKQYGLAATGAMTAETYIKLYNVTHTIVD